MYLINSVYLDYSVGCIIVCCSVYSVLHCHVIKSKVAYEFVTDHRIRRELININMR